MVKRSTFLDAGGFNEHYFTAYQDVDLCLRFRTLGKRNIYTPGAVLFIMNPLLVEATTTWSIATFYSIYGNRPSNGETPTTIETSTFKPVTIVCGPKLPLLN